jgi:hypothetical protein
MACNNCPFIGSSYHPAYCNDLIHMPVAELMTSEANVEQDAYNMTHDMTEENASLWETRSRSVFSSDPDDNVEPEASCDHEFKLDTTGSQELVNGEVDDNLDDHLTCIKCGEELASWQYSEPYAWL